MKSSLKSSGYGMNSVFGSLVLGFAVLNPSIPSLAASSFSPQTQASTEKNLESKETEAPPTSTHDLEGRTSWLDIPLGASKEWIQLRYRKKPANEVIFFPQTLRVKVENSASVLIHKLKSRTWISDFSFLLEFSGDLRSPGKAQVWDEDFQFRLGLVAEGKDRLNALRRAFAANWILQLFELAPADSGLDKVYFFNVGRAPGNSLGDRRLHPLSPYFSEEIVALRAPGQKRLEVKHTLVKPLPILAIWLSIDGDETNSQYETEIHLLRLKSTTRP